MGNFFSQPKDSESVGSNMVPTNPAKNTNVNTSGNNNNNPTPVVTNDLSQEGGRRRRRNKRSRKAKRSHSRKH